MDDKQLEPVKIEPQIVRDIDNYDLAEADYEVLVQMGIEASEVKTYAQWILGKLGDAETDHYGDLQKYAKDIKVNYGSLQNYMNVYRKFTKEDPNFTPDKYKGSIPWGVLQMVAGRSATPQKLLDELHDEGSTTIESAYKSMKEKEGSKIPAKPKIVLVWDEGVGKFKLHLSPNELDRIDWTDVRQQLLDYLETLT